MRRSVRTDSRVRWNAVRPAVFALLLVLSCPGAGVAQVVINEIMYNPATAQGPDSSWEWVELFNAGASSADLGGWKLYDYDGNSSVAFPTGTQLAPDNYLVLAVVDTNIEGWYGLDSNQVLDWGTSTLSLNNTGDTIYLKDSQGTTVDQVTYDDASPWPSEANGGGPSLELFSPGLDNNQASSWTASKASYGTPGRVNSVTPEPSGGVLFGVGLLVLALRRRRRNSEEN